MKILFPIYCFFVMLFFSLLLLVFVWPAEAAEFDAENSRLFIPELRAGEWCYEDVGIQFFPGEDGMWDGAFQLIQSRVVDCPMEDKKYFIDIHGECSFFDPSVTHFSPIIFCDPDE